MCQRILFFFQAEDGIRDHCVTGVQTCALPISSAPQTWRGNSKSEAIETANHLRGGLGTSTGAGQPLPGFLPGRRSEEHTSELQSHSDLVCRLLLEKKKKKKH